MNRHQLHASSGPGSDIRSLRARTSKADTRLTDAVLVKRMASRDECALGLLYDRWSRLVYNIAAKIVSREDAEEILEDTFWQAWRSAEQYCAERGKVSTWLTMIARSRALERRRAEGRGTQTEQWSDADRQTRASSWKSPLSETMQEERRLMIAKAIEQLPEDQRETVVLAYFGGLSQSEIAERLKQPVGTIKSRIRLASAKLKVYLSVLSDATT